MERVLVHLLTVLLIDGLSFVHSVVYSAQKQAHNQYTEDKDLSLSSNREDIRYRVRSNIFRWFPNDMAKNILEMAWSNLEAIRGFLAHEMID